MTREEARKTLVHFAIESENQITMAINLQCRKAINMAIKALEQPERKKVEWFHLGGDEWCCPACGFVITTEGSWEHPLETGNNFCKNCCADMRGEKE